MSDNGFIEHPRGLLAGLKLFAAFMIFGPLVGFIVVAVLTMGLAAYLIAYPPLIYLFGGPTAFMTGLFAIWHRPRATRRAFVLGCGLVGTLMGAAGLALPIFAAMGDPNLSVATPVLIAVLLAAAGGAGGAVVASRTYGRPERNPLAGDMAMPIAA